jgi:2-polyprenyl-3-methyl-5-hydroxy-6-metoxy-1,4-benzoquinol methylase
LCQSGPVVEDDITAHYAHGREASRLTRSAHGRLELVRTRELVRRVLPPPPARVLDVGGGTGVHAHWLAEDGYPVHVVDPMPLHVETAAALPGVTAEIGDVRSLATPTGSVDVVLLLGPLYHLVSARDRAVALDECRRVLRPGGVIVAAAISRYVSLLEVGTNGRLSGDLAPSVAEVIATGRHDGHLGFVESH